MTRLVGNDKDLIIMVPCIGTIRTHICAASAPSLASVAKNLGWYSLPAESFGGFDSQSLVLLLAR